MAESGDVASGTRVRFPLLTPIKTLMRSRVAVQLVGLISPSANAGTGSNPVSATPNILNTSTRCLVVTLILLEAKFNYSFITKFKWECKPLRKAAWTVNPVDLCASSGFDFLHSHQNIERNA